MRLFLSLIIVFLASFSLGLAQTDLKIKHIEEINIDQEKRDLTISYSFKKRKEKTSMLKVKFYNKTKANLNVDLVMGFYSNGVLLEKAGIVDCLKKSFFSNLFRPYHMVETSFEEGQEVEIKILNFYSEQIDECRETH